MHLKLEMKILISYFELLILRNRPLIIYVCILFCNMFVIFIFYLLFFIYIYNAIIGNLLTLFVINTYTYILTYVQLYYMYGRGTQVQFLI